MSKIIPSDVELNDLSEKASIANIETPSVSSGNFLKRTFNVSPLVIGAVTTGSFALVLTLGVISGVLLRECEKNSFLEANSSYSNKSNFFALKIDSTAINPTDYLTDITETTDEISVTNFVSYTDPISSTETTDDISVTNFVSYTDPISSTETVAYSSVVSTSIDSLGTSSSEDPTDSSNYSTTPIFFTFTIPTEIKSTTTNYTLVDLITGLTLPTITSATSKTSSKPIIPSDFRLSGNIKPINYDLTIKTYFQPYSIRTNDDEYFEGTVKISIRLDNDADFIRLHVDKSLLIYDQIKISDDLGNTSTYKNESSNYKEHELYEIDLGETLSAGDYVLEMEFSGRFGNLYGFYKSKYTENDMTKSVLTTLFEPTMARTAFPCFDEPSFKATFEITIEHPNNSIALSNWPQKSSDPFTADEGLRIRTVFEKTYKMSTYLVSFTVVPDDYGFLTIQSNNGKQIRVFAKNSSIENGQADFALNTAKLTLDFFENVYFKISDAVPPKIDLISFPSFGSGGMEHWGLISFSDSALLYSDKQHSVQVKQYVALIIAHELAHFWFGNYVTCEWWDDLYLNEAMATFLQYKAIEYVYPEMDITDQYIVERTVPVMFEDGFDVSEEVQSDVLRPEDINGLFNSFKYSKGASILFMLESTVGPDNFKAGLIGYLNAHPFDSGKANSFYDGLQMPQKLVDANINGSVFMEDFLNQINYPSVKVELTQNIQTNKTKVTFSQQRFFHFILQFPLEDHPSKFDYMWKLYLQCKVGGIYNPNDLDDNSQHVAGSIEEFDFYLGKTSDSIELNRSISWIKCNKDFKGYYLTDYSDYNFKAIEFVMNRNQFLKAFSIGDRAHLIHSAYALSYAGIKKYDIPNYLTSYMEFSEKEYVPWKVYFWHLEKMATILEHRASFKYLRNFAIRTTRSLANEEGLEDLWNSTDNSHINQMLKINAIEFLCRFQDELCLNKATELFKTIPNEFFGIFSDLNTNPVDPNNRAQVYKYHMQNSNDYEDFIKLDLHYYYTLDPHENYNALKALSHHRSAWLLEGLLSELLASDDSIKPDHFFELIGLIGENTAGRHQAWNFVRRHFDEIVKEYGNGVDFAYAVQRICGSFSYFYLYEEMEKFFKTTSDGYGHLIRKQTDELVLNNIYWIKIKEKEVIENFFLPDL